MSGKLSNNIALAFFINVFAIMSVGGVCTLMVRDMVQNISHLEIESGNVDFVYKLNDKTQKAIFIVHSAIVNFDDSRKDEVFAVLKDAGEQLLSYQEKELSRDISHVEEERLLLNKIYDNLNSITRGVQKIYKDLDVAGVADGEGFMKIESYGHNIHKLSQSINDVHFETVSALVKESYSRMYFILLLYLVSSIIGILASCVGYVVLTRHTIRPIINLASATEKISAGGLDIRLETTSETEIGTLYHSFNAMTEKLQEHEKKREDFNRTLEMLVRDRTQELRESEKSLIRTQSELVRMEKIATLGHIATAVNHEIKTPLNVLYMNLQLLNRKINKCTVEASKEKQGMLDITEIINDEVCRINGIIEEFVKYARFPAPKIKDNNINNTLSGISELIQQNATENDVVVELDLDESMENFAFDKKMLIQAFLNLCMNAIQAMPYGGSLHLQSVNEYSSAKIIISDTGSGISAEDQKHIFDPFFTKKNGGLGFGLAIVQRIIEDHRGAIFCKSEVDKGTIFEVTLPISAERIIT